MMNKSQLQVEAIHNGTVIDHIPAGQGIKILQLFGLAQTHEKITVGLNLPSKALGAKDIIKVENTRLSAAQANQLALFAPQATVNLIEDFEVVEKLQLQLPEKVEGVFSCPNSNCISHNEPVTSKFRVRAVDGQVRFRCRYCEKSFHRDMMAV
ncbi:aspartate carbamoyltransferase regulatory subunit [Zobellella denitrificans]|jgi:aspartate carbamoyltransferase regulatory subunit|uniref:Aspartate carbamoyltransferase regulatory chain n=1 Tax=Zobellella denitrificans TaxID=347534 RepID=A0A231MZV3_9GAMM|nr:aspartate carbamoyltransferase regulatory subunit [Zobellella denitrificans]ATG72961.1 aspartate carbamoyltransferase regulatory subunit [Zobellella denitrificans]OXS15737.1 aspartate carbamoyltransferase regulatory subunit [Zobellella denitrificans]